MLNSPTDYALIGLFFFAAHLVATVTGFGTNIVGLPLLTLVIGLDPAKQSLVTLSALLYAYMTLRWHGRVNWRELRFILIVAGTGLIVGIAIAARLNQRVSTILLAVFVMGVGLRGLLNLAPQFRAPEWLSRLLLFAGGVVHGAFTTGGPLLVVYCNRALPHKSVFRSTLGVMWLTLAAGLMIGWTITREWHPDTPGVCLIGLPFLVAGLIVGEWLHHRADERKFRVAVNFTLVATGIVLLVTQCK